jgi:hypothetical protein
MNETHRANTLTGYLDVIRKIRDTFAGNDPTTPVWFRGHCDASWKLVPTLYRGDVDPYWEREFLRDFKLRSGVLITRPPINDLEWLYVIRHHGGPTRILDWSESPLVALFFALHRSNGSTPACVWALRPWSLNEESLEWMSIPSTDRKDLTDYTLQESDRKVVRSVKAKWPVAVRPQRTIHRAIGQSGMFTIHGSSRDPLESIKLTSKRDPWLQPVEIDAQACMQVFWELYNAGITPASIFPDLDGLAADLSFRYSNRYIPQPTTNGTPSKSPLRGTLSADYPVSAPGTSSTKRKKRRSE